MDSSPVLHKNARTQAEWELRELERQKKLTNSAIEQFNRQEVVLRQDLRQLAQVCDQLDCRALSVKASKALKAQGNDAQIQKMQTLLKIKPFTSKESGSQMQYHLGMSKDSSEEGDRIELLQSEDLTFPVEARLQSLERAICGIAKTQSIDEALPIISAKTQATFSQEFSAATRLGQELKLVAKNHTRQLKQLVHLFNS